MKSNRHKLFGIGSYILFVVAGFFLLLGIFGLLTREYDNDPEKRMHGLIFTIIGAAIVVATVSTAIAQKKYADTDGDGVAGDGLPASEAQKALLTREYKKIGQYFDAEKKLTQGDFRQILKNLQKHQ